MKVSVQTRSGRDLGTFEVDEGATVAQLQPLFHKAHPKLYPDRQRFYLADAAGKSASTPSSATTSSQQSGGGGGGSKSKRPAALKEDYVLTDGAKLQFKDLGPQISWKVVFLIEYLGPLLLYPLFFTQPRFIYGEAATAAPVSDWVREVQLSATIAWTFHYAKREFETLLIHRFSHATMPIFNLAKNCSYYWGFAAYVAYFVNHPLYTPPPKDLFYVGMCLFYFMEIGNLSAHITLRMLRPAGSKVRRIPRGGLFEFVSCPNYTYEILAWLGFNLMTRTLAGILFMLAGATQMVLWAQGKHRRYRREFDGKEGRALYPTSRRIILPFIY